MLDFYVNDQGWVGVLYYDVNDSLWSKTSKKLGTNKAGSCSILRHRRKAGTLFFTKLAKRNF